MDSVTKGIVPGPIVANIFLSNHEENWLYIWHILHIASKNISNFFLHLSYLYLADFSLFKNSCLKLISLPVSLIWFQVITNFPVFPWAGLLYSIHNLCESNMTSTDRSYPQYFPIIFASDDFPPRIMICELSQSPGKSIWLNFKLICEEGFASIVQTHVVNRVWSVNVVGFVIRPLLPTKSPPHLFSKKKSFPCKTFII